MTASALKNKTKQQLIDEVEALRRRVAELETTFPAERFRRLIEAVPQAILISDESGQIVLVNERAEALFGYQPGELVGLSIEGLLPEQFRERHTRQRATFFAHPQPRPLGLRRELNARRKDGSEFLVEIGLSHAVTEEGTVALAFVTDITERKRAEVALQLAQFTVDNAAESIVWIDPDGTIIYANEAAHRATHTVPGTMVGAKAWHFNKEFTEQSWQEDWEQLRQKGSITREVTLSGPHGEITNYEAVVTYIAFNDKELQVSYNRDVTERKRAETALHLSEERFRALVENSPAGIYMADDTFHLLYANQQLADLVGYPLEELMARDFRSFIAEDDVNRLVDIYVRRRRGEDVPNHFEFDAIRKNGEKRRLEGYTATTVFPDGTTRSLGQILDVTERKRTEEALRASEERLRLVTDNVRDMIMQSDEAGIIRYVSPSAQDVWGIAADDLIRTPLARWLALVHPDDREFLDTILSEYRHGRLRPSQWTYRFQHGPGRYRWKEQVIDALRRKDGSLSGFTHTIRDITERVTANEDLRKANERFLKAFHASPIGISISTLNEGRYADVNDAFVEMYGFKSRDQLIGKTSAELGTWANIVEREEMIRRFRERKTIGSFPYQFRHQSGEVREALCASVLIELDGEEYILSMFQDTTERKRMEEALRRVNRAYRVLSDCNSSVVRSADEQSLLEEVCQTLVETGGYLLAWVGFAEHDGSYGVRPVAKAGSDAGYLETIKTTWDDSPTGRGPTGIAVRTGRSVMVADLLTDPAFEPWRSDAVQRGYRSSIALPLVVGDRVLGVLNIYARERDAFFEEEIRLLEQLAGNLAYGIVSLQVQAERTHIENDLREREGLLSAIVNSQIDLICRYTPDTILTFVNDAYCLYLGRSRQELVGRSFLTLVPEEQHAGIWARIEEAIRTHVPAVREYYTFSPGGEVRWVQWVDQAVQDNHGQLLIQAVGRDVTAQKQAEEALLDMNSQLEQRVKERTADLQAANERLQALSRVKDEFVSNVSHELRTPITSLKLRQHLVRKSPENLNQHLEVMERETNRLHHTIEDLLQLSRLDQRQTELTLSPVDINALVKQYISDRSTVAEANSLKVTLTENGALPVVAADVGLLEQCLGILMSNAINYTPPGGSITIEAVTQTIEGCRWAGFMVADNGPGILPEDQPHLFERFYRGTAAHKSGSRGTGLGLAIAREIVVRHGGRIEVESTGVPGEGARFTVWLPEQA